MALSLREYRARIKSTESMKKITRAMELIAASRIIKAQQRAQAAAPYARELTRAVSAVATFSNVDHPLTKEEEDAERLRSEGKEIDTYIAGRKGEAYFRFRQRPIVRSWTGFSDQPSYDVAAEIGRTLIDSFVKEQGEEGDVDEVHVVYTRFRSMLTQEPTAIRVLPLEVVEADEAGAGDETSGERPGSGEVLPLYEFEPSAEAVLDALLPQYVQSRIFFALLQAAASELAARQKAMKSATDNAEELIKKYTRVANQARQAGITQEISEIVGGVNALADAQAEAQ
jgi:F-type H+-transporting ATPase subunit gamma